MALNGKKTTSLKNKIVLTSYLVKENCSNCINREQVLNVIKKGLRQLKKEHYQYRKRHCPFYFGKKPHF